jgi:hypothetical protein
MWGMYLNLAYIIDKKQFCIKFENLKKKFFSTFVKGAPV